MQGLSISENWRRSPPRFRPRVQCECCWSTVCYAGCRSLPSIRWTDRADFLTVSAQIAVFHHTLYAASKAAVSAMVLNLALELGECGITINAIAPSGTATDMAEENGKLYTPRTTERTARCFA
ncbi:MAG: SDR family oxidoreductase [Chroococcidiopsidaceae cyanobacterium CP_BM_RX_35]|nr:SDR family oxidoreductase [Chroococcidiopsidaceae cyanobacterium CP_BM_RX_35]